MVGLTRDALVTLRAVLFRDAGANAAAYLQEAGYAGGGALYHAFAAWNASRGLPTPESMPASEFQERGAEFFAPGGRIAEIAGVVRIKSPMRLSWIRRMFKN